MNQIDVHRILVVDDDKEVLNFVSSVLKNAGYEVIEARDGDEALKFIRAGGIDLLITDLMMPETDGLELLTQLRSRRTLKIIAMSGGGVTRQNNLKTARLLGAAYTLAKPFSGEDLLAAVREVAG
jgi:two-component system chemotaxis response regulator CheY